MSIEDTMYSTHDSATDLRNHAYPGHVALTACCLLLRVLLVWIIRRESAPRFNSIPSAR